MANAILKISKRAKQIRRAHKNMTWRACIKQASGEYNRGRLGASRKHSVKRTIHRSKKPVRRKVSAVSTAPRKRVTANIQVGKLGTVPAGTLAAELRRRAKERIDRAIVRKFHATRKTDKRRIQREITAAKSELKRLS